MMAIISNEKNPETHTTELHRSFWRGARATGEGRLQAREPDPFQGRLFTRHNERARSSYVASVSPQRVSSRKSGNGVSRLGNSSRRASMSVVSVLVR